MGEGGRPSVCPAQDCPTHTPPLIRVAESARLNAFVFVGKDRVIANLKHARSARPD